MESENDSHAMNEYQELLVDAHLLLVDSKGKLFNYKAIGGHLSRGRDLPHVLGDFWTRDIKRLCTAALERGVSGTQLYENNRNGSNMSLLFGATPAVRSGRIGGLILKISDITARRRLERQRELRNKMKMISQLAAQMVHKMNNPIAAILNRISGLLVRDQDNTDPNLHTELQGIQEQLYTVSLLTNALTAFSKEDRKNFKLVQLNSIVENTLHLLRLFNSEHNVEFQIQLDPDLPRVLGNEVTLEQCFVNICKNAIEAMPSGGLLSIVSKVDDQFPDFVNISFSDRGPGIPAEDLSTVIDPFFTTKDKGHFGLGLSVCFGVISNHNGSVEISSQQGQGTTVQIILPIVKI